MTDSSAEQALPLEPQGSKAPLFWPLLFWCLGLYFGRNLPDGGWLLLAVASAFTLLAIFLPRLRLWLLLLSVMLAGTVRISTRSPQELILENTIAERGRIVQTATFEVRKEFSNHSYEITLKELAGAKFKLPLLLYHPQKLDVDSHYRAVLKLEKLKQDPILDFFPSRYKSRATVDHALEKIDDSARPNYIGKLRSRLDARIEKHAGDWAPIAKALLLSDQTAKGQYSDTLRRGGMTHLIVVSGLHVLFLYSLLMLLFRSFLPHKAAELLIIIACLGFAALNYWSAPVTRAVLMITIGILARWLGRKVSALQVLSICLWVITLAAPQQLFDAGLQLSFLCVGILSLALPKIQLWSEKRGRISLLQRAVTGAANYLLLNVMVSIAILPLTLYHFGSGSLNGVVGNLLGVPLMSLILPLSILMLVGPSSSLITQAFVSSYKLAVWLFERWMLIAAGLPFHVEDFWLDLLPALGLALFLLPFYIWIKSRKKPNWGLYIPMWLIALTLIIVPPFFAADKTGIWVFNCGTADCSLIITPDKHSILVDTGQGSKMWDAKGSDTHNSWAARKLIPLLKKKNIKRIDSLILTHTDADHAGGIPALATSLPIGRLIITDETYESDLWAHWQSQGWFSDSEILLITDTLSIHQGKTRLKFLHPDKDYVGTSENNRSIVFRLDVKDKSYLFTGDIEAKDERWLISRYPEEIDTDYLKVPHHGSKSSSTDEFIYHVSPIEAWISVGIPNRYKFPHASTIQTLQKYDAEIKITNDGTVYTKF
ncbi:MAG TPA: DNA internalization-related competence protein ComEC/Rec2 [Candidatus Cloacimonas sp.]|nr:DNA internalization-related competence protein ComEC/Rec2 [Candidatus Cloacimonas sp.]